VQVDCCECCSKLLKTQLIPSKQACEAVITHQAAQKYVFQSGQCASPCTGDQASVQLPALAKPPAQPQHHSLASTELCELGNCPFQKAQLVMGLPAVEGSHNGSVLHKAGSPAEGRRLPSLVLPLLHSKAEAAVLQAACSLLEDCLTAALPMGNALPFQQHSMPITLETKGHCQADLLLVFLPDSCSFPPAAKG